MLLIVFAVVFLFVLWMIKNGIPFVHAKPANEINPQTGLTYTTTVGNLVAKDTDGDGIPDWEEGLWGTDPAKKETTPGVPDSSAIARLKAQQNANAGISTEKQANSTEKLTKTDQFSRELLSTVTALNQGGAMDQATVDQISSSLADHIQNIPQQKVYGLSDLKVIRDESMAAAAKFSAAVNSTNTRYPVNGNVLDILQRFMGDGDTVDTGVLAELSPVINQMKARLSASLKVSVPEPFSLPYLGVINDGEKIIEDLTNIQSYDTDPIVALGGISQYQQSSADIADAIQALAAAITQKSSGN